MIDLSVCGVASDNGDASAGPNVCADVCEGTRMIAGGRCSKASGAYPSHTS